MNINESHFFGDSSKGIANPATSIIPICLIALGIKAPPQDKPMFEKKLTQESTLKVY